MTEEAFHLMVSAIAMQQMKAKQEFLTPKKTDGDYAASFMCCGLALMAIFFIMCSWLGLGSTGNHSERRSSVQQEQLDG